MPQERKQAAGNVAVSRFSGKIAIGLGSFCDFVVELKGHSLAEKYVLDLSKVMEMDSASMGEIVALSRLFKRKGRKFAILKPPERVMRHLRLSQLLRELNVFETEDEAARYMAA